MKSKSSNTALLILGMLFKFSSVFSQAGTLTQVPANQSPQAASLGKFVEVPVGLYNGTLNINVPLYSFPVHELNIPVSLSYNASGLKVKDIAGQVGTGFSLNAGGIITRIVRGYPDHYNLDAVDPYSYFDTLKNQKILNAAYMGMEAAFNDDERYHILLSVPGVRAENLTGAPFLYWNRPLDTEMDNFYFSFLGYSGVFTFTNSGEALILSGTKDLKISYEYGKYKIINAEGVEFYFNDREYAYMNYSSEFESKYTSSWYLSKIYIPRHKDSIDFHYRQYTNSVLYQTAFMQNRNASFFSTTNRVKWLDNTIRIGSFTIGWADCPDYSAQSSLNYPNELSSSLFISEIAWNDNKILFYGDTTRTDIYKYKLDSIKVKYGNETVSTTKLNYSYFNAADTEADKKRLKLNDLYINDARYQFDYIDSLWGRGTPSIYTKGYDIWGYYNGEEDEDVIPFYKFFSSGIFPDYNYYIHNANSAPKNSDYKWAQLGTLKSITYPTGGKALFEYEGNDYSKVGFLSSSMSIESDPFTQIQLDSTGYKQVVSYTNPYTTTHSKSIQREFVVHVDQISNINIKMGMTYQDVSYAAYVDTIYGWWESASVTISKFNDITGAFETIWTHNVLPKDSIGLPTTVSDYNSLKMKGRMDGVRSVALTEGRYRVDLFLNGYYLDGDVGIEVKFPYKKNPGIYYGAGLRVKKQQFVSNSIIDTSYVKCYNYMSDSISSGVLESPFGNISKSFYWGGFHTIRSGVSYQNNCGFIDFTSDPSIPLGNAQGGVIGYSKVTEIREDQAKIVHHFTNGAFSPYGAGDSYFSPSSSIPVRTRIQYDNSWKRGLPTQVDYYDSSGLLVKQEFTLYYVIDNESYKKSVSMIVDDVILNATGSNSLGAYSKTENYYTRSTGHSLKWRDSTVFYTSTDTLSEVTYYEYPYAAWPHDRPISIKNRNSMGGYTITHFRYPQDFTSIGAAPINQNARSIKTQILKNVLSPVIEKYQEKSDANGSNLRTISGEYVKYDTSGTMADTLFSLELNSPLPNYDGINIDSARTIKDSHYKAKVIFSRYDDFGNIIEQSKANDVKEVLLWGYKNQYPVARVTGSDYNTVSALVDMNILNNPSSDLQLLTELNKIRVHFSGSQVLVFTYAYAPLRGITVEVDPRGRKMTYVYDTQGRLSQIKDHEGNIVKMIKYSYAL